MKIRIDKGGRTRPKTRDTVGDFVSSASRGQDELPNVSITLGLTEFDEHGRRESVSVSMTPEETKALISSLVDHLEWVEGRRIGNVRNPTMQKTLEKLFNLRFT